MLNVQSRISKYMYVTRVGRLPQKEDSDYGPKPELRGTLTPNPTPHLG